jgi:ligand-binding sensor domain-containing protein
MARIRFSFQDGQEKGTPKMGLCWEEYQKTLQGVVWLCLSLGCLAAATGEMSLSDEYSMRQFGVDQGLPQGSVTSLLQDREGYLWVATFGGVARFDGIFFESFPSLGPKRLGNARMTLLKQTEDGRIWVLSEDGRLGLVGSNEIRPFVLKDTAPEARWHTLFSDTQGHLWLAGATEGLFCLCPQGKVHTMIPFQGHRVRALAQGPGDLLWVATTTGLFLGNRQGFHAIAHPIEGDSFQRLRHLFAVGDRLLIPSDKTLFLYDHDQKQWTRGPGFLDHSVLIQSAVLLTSQRILLGSDHGLFVFDTKKNTMNPMLISPLLDERKTIGALLLDASGHLWIGGHGLGLCHLRPKRIHMIDAHCGFLVEEPTSLVQTLDRKVWAGLNCGGIAFKEAGGSWSVHGGDFGINNCVWALSPRRQGGVWWGNWTGDVGTFDGKHIGLLKHAIGEDRDAPVMGLLEDDQGALWIGTRGDGVFVFQHGVQTAHYLANQGLWGQVSSVVQGLGGQMFVATDAGLARIGAQDGGAFWGQEHGLANVRSLLFDDQGWIWMATYGYGLFVKHGEVITPLRSDQGFHDAYLSGLAKVEDRLWVSGNRGIASYPLDQLRAMVQGEQSSIEGQRFGSLDGMNTQECVGGFQSPVLHHRDGSLWFSTVKGIATLDPRETMPASGAPTVLIRRILVNGAEEALDEEVHLLGRDNRVTIQCAGNFLTSPGLPRFRYRLKGFWDEWTEMGQNGQTYLPSLPPGRYFFEVFAGNASGVWSQNPATLTLVVRLPWYQRLWVQLLVVVGVMLAGSALFLRMRGRYRKRVHHSAMVRGITTGLLHEIRQPMQILRSRLDLLKIKTGVEDRRHVQSMIQEIERMDRVCRQIEQLAEQDELVYTPYVGSENMVYLDAKRPPEEP